MRGDASLAWLILSDGTQYPVHVMGGEAKMNERSSRRMITLTVELNSRLMEDGKKRRYQ